MYIIGEVKLHGHAHENHSRRVGRKLCLVSFVPGTGVAIETRLALSA